MLRQHASVGRRRESQSAVIGLTFVLALGVGCGSRAPRPQVDPGPPPAPVQPPAARPTPAPPPPPPAPTPLRVAVLVSDEQPAYVTVADELVRLAGADNAGVFHLQGKTKAAGETVKRVRDAGYENVVAIGLLAAQAAKQLASARVVFCQVFNHQEHQLLNAHTRGIESIPPLDDAIDVWQKLGKRIRSVGVITGAGHDDDIAQARRSLARRGITLRHQVTASDKQTIVELQRMLPDIDAYWLLPDNRVLSRSALRDLMALSRRAAVGVLVHDPRFFELGGLISAANVPGEIAAQAYDVLENARDDGRFPGGAMQRLRRSRVQVNGEVAAQLGYRLDALPKALVAQ